MRATRKSNSKNSNRSWSMSTATTASRISVTPSRCKSPIRLPESIPNSMLNLEEMKLAVIDALEDIKAFDITVMDVRNLTSMTSYMIVASANSTRQAKAIADNVREKMREKGINMRGTEGEKDGEW